MRLARALVIALSVCMGATALAGDTVGVNGSNVQYPVSKTATLGDKQFEQKLTGAGMRKKAIINVYTIGSYVDKEFTGKTPDDLACADCVKQLHLVLQRRHPRRAEFGCRRSGFRNRRGRRLCLCGRPRARRSIDASYRAANERLVRWRSS